MTTKTIQHRKNIKEVIPPGYETIRGAVKFLNRVNIEISYDGLSYYRKMGIIDKPVRFKGHMDKFYQLYPLQVKILTAKLLTTFLSIKLQDLAKYMTKLSPEIYLQLPIIILKTYEAVWGFKKYSGPLEQYRGVTDLYGTLYIGMKKILDETLKKAGLEISMEKFSELLKEEAQCYKETLEQRPGYKSLLIAL